MSAEILISVSVTALTAGLGALVSVVIKRLFGRLSEIHVLVNSQMGAAQAEIIQLKAQVASLHQTVSTLTRDGKEPSS